MNKALKLLVKKNPLIHEITNLVSMNDCANISLALGGSPIMAIDPKEVSDITSISDVLLINLGTLSDERLKSMKISIKRAKEKKIPVIIDPVGVAASPYRLEGFYNLMEEEYATVIRGNFAEIEAILRSNKSAKGVDYIGEDSLEYKIETCKELAKKYKTVVVASGKIDIITDGNKVEKISGGVELLKKVTGTGCMTTCLIGGFLSVKDPYIASSLGMELMAEAGEFAHQDIKKEGLGLASFKNYLIDYISIKSGTVKVD